MKRLFSVLMVFPFLVTCGCEKRGVLPIAREIQNLELVLTLGLDKQEDGQMTITVISSSDGMSSDSVDILNSSADTISRAAQQMRSKTEKDLFFGHVEQVVLGENAASFALDECMDYLNRDIDMRPGINMFVAKDITAQQLLEDCGVSATKQLRFFGENADVLEQSYLCTVGDATRQRLRDGGVLIPAVSQRKTDEKSEVLLSGYALLDEHKTVSYMQNDAAAGADILYGKAGSNIVQVWDGSGSAVALKFTQSKVKYEADFDGSDIGKLTVSIYVQADINEVHGENNIFKKEELDDLEIQLSEKCKKAAEETLNAAIASGIDIFTIGRKLAAQHPVKMHDIAWETTYKTLKPAVIVSAKISRTYDLSVPVKGE